MIKADKKALAFRPCAICGKPVVEAYKPFCSKRCANIDLGRWLKGSYAIAGSVDKIVPVDVFVPGCPPDADTIFYVISELVQGRIPILKDDKLYWQ